MKKILIAEDEKPMAKALKLKLEKEGFEVHSVFNGKEALAALEKEKFDLVLLDLVMPKLDGFGVLEGVRAKKIKTKIIVSTNLSQEQDSQKAKELGAVDYFIKSNTPLIEVVKHVKKILD